MQLPSDAEDPANAGTSSPDPYTAEHESAKHLGVDRKRRWRAASNLGTLSFGLFLAVVAVVLWISRFEVADPRHCGVNLSNINEVGKRVFEQRELAGGNDCRRPGKNPARCGG